MYNIYVYIYIYIYHTVSYLSHPDRQGNKINEIM